MKKWVFGSVVAGVLAVSGAVMAAGFFQWPLAGSSPYTFTFPLVGIEQVPMDTQIPGGSPPQTITATWNQMLQGQVNTATNTSSFTATTAQVWAGSNGTLLLSGTLAAGANLTTPTATALVQAIQARYSTVPVGYTWMIKFVNNSSGAFAWTIVGGTGVTVSGGLATVSQGDSRCYMASVTGVGTPAVTLTNVGNGCS